MIENVQFKRWFFEKFSAGIAPRLPYWGGATAPLSRPHPLGAPALRASRASLGTFGPSIVRPWYRVIFAIPILKCFRRPWRRLLHVLHITFSMPTLLCLFWSWFNVKYKCCKNVIKMFLHYFVLRSRIALTLCRNKHCKCNNDDNYKMQTISLTNWLSWGCTPYVLDP